MKRRTDHKRYADVDKAITLLGTLASLYKARDVADVEKTILKALVKVGFSSARLYHLDDRNRLVGLRASYVSGRVQKKYEQGKIVLASSSKGKNWQSFAALNYGKPLVVRVDPDGPVIREARIDGNGIAYVQAKSARLTKILGHPGKSEWLDFPLIVDGRPIGKIALDKARGAGRITPEDYSLMLLMFQPMTTAIAASGWFTGYSLPPERIHDFWHRFSRVTNLDELLETAASIIQEAFKARNCSLFLVHEPFVPRRVKCSQPEVLVLWRTTLARLKSQQNKGFYYKGQGLTGDVWAMGEPVFVPDVASDKRWQGHLNDSDVHEVFVAAPIPSPQGKVRGVVRIPTDKSHRLLRHEAFMLNNFASTVLGPAIENHIRIDRANKFYALMRLFHQHLYSVKLEASTADPTRICAFAISACEEAFGSEDKKIIAYSVNEDSFRIEQMAGTLVLNRQYENRLSYPRDYGSAANKVLETGEPLFLTDVAQARKEGAYFPLVAGVRCAMIVPLGAGRDAAGVLAVVSSRYDLLPERDLVILQVIALLCMTLRQMARIVSSAQTVERHRMLEQAAYQLKAPAMCLKAYGSRILDGFQGNAAPDQEDIKRLLHFTDWLYYCSDRIVYSIENMSPFLRRRWTKAQRLASRIEGTLQVITEFYNLKELEVRINNTVKSKVRCLVDSALIVSATISIFENALKASGPRGKVVVKLAESNGNLKITVRDQGGGIDPENLKIVKRPGVHIAFEQGAEYPPGSGYGLTVAEKVVVAHGGELRLKSDGKSYTEARITVPLKRRSK